MRAAALAFLLLAAAPSAAAAAPDFATVDSIATAEMRASGTPGAAIAVVLGDSVVWSRGFGVASVESTEPVTPSTLFRVASTTKMLVAAALAALAERGTIDFDAPIAGIDRTLEPSLGRLTVHQLLSHTAGLADETSYEGPHDEAALGRFVRSWGADRFFTAPGRIYSYSNPGYALAGHVLAEAADTTFDAAMARVLFAPLGMTHSTFLPTLAMTRPFAQAHDPGRDGPVVVRPFPDDARFRPNGGAFTSAEEFARFARAFVNEGRIGGVPAMPPGVIARLERTHARRPGGSASDSARIAYGLVERRIRGVRVLQHGGARLGSGSIVRMAPEAHFAVVILTNRTGSFLPQTLERISALALPAVDAPAPTPKPPSTAWGRDERRDLVGAWVNHRPDLVFELFLEQGTLRARQPGEATSEPVTKLDARRYAFGGQEFEALGGTDGMPLYLHLAGRAFARP